MISVVHGAETYNTSERLSHRCELPPIPSVPIDPAPVWVVLIARQGDVGAGNGEPVQSASRRIDDSLDVWISAVYPACSC